MRYLQLKFSSPILGREFDRVLIAGTPIPFPSTQMDKNHDFSGRKPNYVHQRTGLLADLVRVKVTVGGQSWSLRKFPRKTMADVKRDK